jgi:hypothetical protein
MKSAYLMAEFEIPTFSSDARRSLENAGFQIFTLEGNSTNPPPSCEKSTGPASFCYHYYRYPLAFRQAAYSRQGEVAINAQSPFISVPESKIRTRRTTIRVLRARDIAAHIHIFSEHLQRDISGVKAIFGSTFDIQALRDDPAVQTILDANAPKPLYLAGIDATANTQHFDSWNLRVMPLVVPVTDIPTQPQNTFLQTDLSQSMQSEDWKAVMHQLQGQPSTDITRHIAAFADAVVSGKIPKQNALNQRFLGRRHWSHLMDTLSSKTRLPIFPWERAQYRRQLARIGRFAQTESRKMCSLEDYLYALRLEGICPYLAPYRPENADRFDKNSPDVRNVDIAPVADPLSGLPLNKLAYEYYNWTSDGDTNIQTVQTWQEWQKRVHYEDDYQLMAQTRKLILQDWLFEESDLQRFTPTKTTHLDKALRQLAKNQPQTVLERLQQKLSSLGNDTPSEIYLADWRP